MGVAAAWAQLHPAGTVLQTLPLLADGMLRPLVHPLLQLQRLLIRVRSVKPGIGVAALAEGGLCGLDLAEGRPQQCRWEGKHPHRGCRSNLVWCVGQGRGGVSGLEAPDWRGIQGKQGGLRTEARTQRG